MAVTLTIAGTSYSYPSGTDTEWGSDATTAMQAVANNALWKDASVELTANWDVGDYTITAKSFTSDVATGTPPLAVTSTSRVENLNADQVDGKDTTDLVLVDGTQALTANWDAGSYKITAETFESDVAIGTAPFTVTSTTVVSNLNADQVDGADLSTDTNLGASDILVPSQNAVKTYVDGAAKNYNAELQWRAGEFDYPASNPAPLDTDSTAATGVVTTIKRQLFDDSTNESILGAFKVPADINASGTVTFRMYGYATTAAADDVVFTLIHSAAGDGESWDNGGTEVGSGAKTCDASQDNIDIFTWTETVSNLGWSANDYCRFQLERDAENVLDTLSGDYGVILFEINIPRS